MLKRLTEGPKASEIWHATQRGHDGYDGEVTFGLRGHLEAKIASKKFAQKNLDVFFIFCQQVLISKKAS